MGTTAAQVPARSAVAAGGDGPARRGPLARFALAVAILAAFAALIALGTWQLHRLAWKEALIAAASERPNAPAVDAPGPAAWPDLSFDDWDYRRVRLSGRWGAGEVHEWIALGEPKGRLGGPGVFVVAPFTTDAGFTVLVNRGFVPEGAQDPAARPGSAPPDGPATVEGIVRRDDPPTWATPAPDPAKRLVFSRDIGTMAGLLGVDRATTAPYTVDLVARETPAGGLPQAGESLLNFPNSHLQYALTWYGLAAALAGIVLMSLLRGVRRDR